MLHKAAVKTSLNEPRRKLLEMIAQLKHFGTTHVHLVHIRTRSSYRDRESAEEQMERLVPAIEKMGLAVDYSIRNGHAPTEIIRVAEEAGAAYIAILWEPKALLRQALLGSIDSDILRLSNLPTFLYKPSLIGESPKIERVMYATDLQHTDATVMPYLRDSRFRAHTLYLLHVGHRAPDPETEEQRRETLRAGLQRLAAECAHAYDTLEVIESIGMVTKTIVKQARAKGANLIVVGKSDDPDAMTRIVGSTAEMLLHKAPCSVFIIPNLCVLPDQHPVTRQIAKEEGSSA